MQDKEYWSQKGKGHRERLRDKYSKFGLDGFSDEEVLEFLLTIGTPRKDVKGIAREALKQYKSLSGVLSLSKERLMEIDGIGPKNVLYLTLIRDVAKRYLKDKAKQEVNFLKSRDVYDYLMFSMKDLKREVFKVLFLNNKNQLLEDLDLFQGSIRESVVYPREVMAMALEKHAASLIAVHNHPSGDTTPSIQDKDLTKRLVWAGRLLEIRVLDHLIVGQKGFFSFADSGLIEEYSKEYERKYLS